jgi:ATP-binding cassette subfamily F protein 3
MVTLDDYAELLRKETSADNQRNKQSGAANNKPAAVVVAPVDRQATSQRIKQLGNLVKKLEKQIESDKPKLLRLDEALAQCDYSNPEAAKKASQQHEERSKLAAQLELAENELLEAMVEIESLEEALGA